MKLLLVANMYPSEQFPSYGVFVQNVENILKDEGFEVDRAVLQKKTSKTGKLSGYAAYYSKVVSKGLSGKYDAIYVHYAAHNALPLLLLKKLKPSVKIVTNVHGSDVVPEVPSQEKYQPYVKELLSKSSLIITPSHYYESLVKEKYDVDTPIRVFPSGGVNKNVFRSMKKDRVLLLNDLKLDPNFRYFGFVGRLDVGKGWDHYVNAIHMYFEEKPEEKNRTKFIVVGSGKEEGQFKALVEKHKLTNEIVHYPLMKQADLAKVYNIIEAFIFPTTRKGESLGLVGLEAMACGTPIIASAMGGILDYVQDNKNSWLFEPGNPTGLKNQLIHFDSLTDEQIQTIANQAYNTALDYEVEAIKPKLTAIFNEFQRN